MYPESSVSQILMIYCVWADFWDSACALGPPGTFDSLHMHYSVDLGMNSGKLGV